MANDTRHNFAEHSHLACAASNKHHRVKQRRQQQQPADSISIKHPTALRRILAEKKRLTRQ